MSISKILMTAVFYHGLNALPCLQLSDRAAARLWPLQLSDSGGFAQLEHLFAIRSRKHMHDASYDSGPSSLMAGVKAGPVIAVEIFVEQQQILPMGIFLKFARPAVNRPSPNFISHKDASQSSRKPLGNLIQRHLPALASRTFHPEIIPIVGPKVAKPEILAK